MPSSSTREVADCYVRVSLDCTCTGPSGYVEEDSDNAKVCTHMGGILGIWLGMAGAHWPVLLAPAACRCSGVGWGGHGKERSFQVPRALH